MKPYCCLTLLATALAATAVAAEPRQIQWQELPEVSRHGKHVGEPGIPVEMMTEGFLAAHPDIRWRREGLHDFTNRRYDEAMTHFRQAARFSDKAAQAMIAEMYWKGLGVPKDPVQAYIWMDLAAERQYPNFMILRESYWAELDLAQQRAALELGQAVYAEFGDDVAQPRLDRVLKRARSQMTGGRLRSTAGLRIIPMTGPLASNANFNDTTSSPAWLNGGAMTLSGDTFYADKYWRPESYRQMRDEIWKSPLKGEVEVGDLEASPEPATR